MNRKIVAFCCENSGLKAADGTVDLVALPCSGKAEIGLILRALERGYGGVLVLGCPRGNCLYLKGNLRAEKRVDRVRTILRDIGIEEDRVRMEYISSVDAHRFAEAVRRMQEALAAMEGGLN